MAFNKLCLSCFRKIPLFAGRCPYCIDENQGVHGRVILLLIFLVGLIWFAHSFDNEVRTTKDIDQKLMREFEEKEF
jgi:hypothetical protein